MSRSVAFDGEATTHERAPKPSLECLYGRFIDLLGVFRHRWTSPGFGR